jgi:hypothetical protein
MTSDPFFNLLQRLQQANVDFVLVGGFAAAVYGCTLVTQDIDICCDFSQENLLRLQKALDGIHPIHRMTPNRIKLELTIDNAVHFKNLYLDTDLGPLDCLSSIEGLGNFKQVVSVSRQIESEGIRLSILTLDALIKAKETINRPRDQQAVIQLKTIKELTKTD